MILHTALITINFFYVSECIYIFYLIVSMDFNYCFQSVSNFVWLNFVFFVSLFVNLCLLFFRFIWLVLTPSR